MDGASGTSLLLLDADAEGPILTCQQGLSLWGGVDPDTGVIMDAHHDRCGASVAGKVVLMPTSRGSCSGSSILLELALNGRAPAALIFNQPDHVLTLGAIVATEMFDRPIAVARLTQDDYRALSTSSHASLKNGRIEAGDLTIDLAMSERELDLSSADQDMLDGREEAALQHAMQILCKIGKIQGANRLIDVTRAHIDGCIYASRAHLTFAEHMRDLGAKITIPTTTNAISVERQNWLKQGVPQLFGDPAERLAKTYVGMGARPSFTCAPYLAEDPPEEAEMIGWSESNAVIFANSVLGARTAKHPDFMDLFIAMTGRAPLAGVYLDKNRAPEIVIDVQLPPDHDDALWPMLGWLAGQAAPDRIPLLTGLADTQPSQDDLKALCAAFGTTSGAPMLHVAGVTPEATLPPAPDAPSVTIDRADLIRAWREFNTGPCEIDLVALGSPHFSLSETRAFTDLIETHNPNGQVSVIITLGAETREQAAKECLVTRLEVQGVQVISDICWCSITEPVFPPEASTLMTNSGKYAHYAPGLSRRAVRFGSLADCARAAETGRAADTVPVWLT